MFCWVWRNSKGGDCTTSWGSLLCCLIIVWVKFLFLCIQQPYSCFSLGPLSLILLLCTWLETVSSVTPPQALKGAAVRSPSAGSSPSWKRPRPSASCQRSSAPAMAILMDLFQFFDVFSVSRSQNCVHYLWCRTQKEKKIMLLDLLTMQNWLEWVVTLKRFEKQHKLKKST